MKNEVQKGDILTFTAPSGGVVSGMAYLMTGILAVALFSAAEGAEFEGQVVGVAVLPKATGTTPAVGGKAYWDNTAKKLTTSSSSTILVGVFTAAALTGDTEVAVRLDGVAR